MTKRARRVDPSPVEDAGDPTKHRGLSVSFDPTEAEWVRALVATLKQQGYRKARRSEVIHVALIVLRDALAGLTREEIVRFFIQRELERLARLANPPSDSGPA